MRAPRAPRRGRGVIGTAVTWALAWVGLGAGIGMVTGMMHLIRIANAETGPSARGESAENDKLDQ